MKFILLVLSALLATNAYAQVYEPKKPAEAVNATALTPLPVL